MKIHFSLTIIFLAITTLILSACGETREEKAKKKANKIEDYVDEINAINRSLSPKGVVLLTYSLSTTGLSMPSSIVNDSKKRSLMIRDLKRFIKIGDRVMDAYYDDNDDVSIYLSSPSMLDRGIKRAESYLSDLNSQMRTQVVAAAQEPTIVNDNLILFEKAIEDLADLRVELGAYGIGLWQGDDMSDARSIIIRTKSEMKIFEMRDKEIAESLHRDLENYIEKSQIAIEDGSKLLDSTTNRSERERLTSIINQTRAFIFAADHLVDKIRIMTIDSDYDSDELNSESQELIETQTEVTL